MRPTNVLPIQKDTRFLWGFFFIALIMGCWLRLDQFHQQILMDDEWHAVFQIERTPFGQLFLQFGHADHSIPMTVYYALVAKFVTLNETLMRLPSMVMGLSFIVIAFFYLKRVNLNIAVIVTLFIACSPLLIAYSRMARPYMIALALCWIALIAFIYYWENRNSVQPNKNTIFAVALYAVAGALAIWLLPVVGPFTIAPFIYYFGKEIISLNRNTDYLLIIKKFLVIGLLFTALTLLLILPPLLSSFEQLAVKAGNDLPNSDTYRYVSYVWLSNSSTPITMTLMLVALIGLPYALVKFTVARVALIGTLLTVVSIYLTKPAWVFNELTFGRYLLPFVPLLFLCIASGIYQITRWVICLLYRSAKKTIHNHTNICCYTSIVSIVIAAVFNFGIYYRSVLPDLSQPTSNSTSGYFYFAPIPDRNPVIEKIDSQYFPTHLKALAEEFITNHSAKGNIVLAPFYFRSDYWAGPLYEKELQKRVLPGFTNGLCNPPASHGELSATPARDIAFQNSIQLSKKNDWVDKNVSLLVWQKPEARPTVQYIAFDDCDRLFASFTPIYEDEYLKIFDIGNQPELVNEFIAKSKQY